ncbi:hypothetical protein MY10362_007407 [Beauveria mimosiformis]
MNSQAVPSVYQNTRCAFTTASIEPGESLAKRRPTASFRSKDFIHRVGHSLNTHTKHVKTGKLNLYLDRETYERSGLSGKLDERNGNREMRSKWCLAIHIPQLRPDKAQAEKPPTLGQLPYTEVPSKPVVSRQIETHQVITPTMPGFEDNGRYDQDTAVELYEWISLVRLQSPRVLHKDSLDAYISRYSVPDCPPGETSVGHISWDGLLSSSWVSTMVSALMASCPEASWFAISATDAIAGGMGGKSEITILKPPGQSSRFLMWDVKYN